MNNSEQKTTFELLASALVLSFVAAVQLMATTSSGLAYAQTGGSSPSVTGRCEFDSNGDPSMVWSLTNLDPSVNYRWTVDDNDPTIGDWDSGRVPSGVSSYTVETISYIGQSADFRIWQQDPSGEFIAATVTITCVPLTERFDNQGQCLAYANDNPDSGITKVDCKAAFKNRN